MSVATTAEVEPTGGNWTESSEGTEPTTDTESTPALPAALAPIDRTRRRSRGRLESTDEVAVPDAVDRWFDEVEHRIDHADALTDASVSTATRTLEDFGSLDAVEALPERISGDAEALRAVAERAESLACRAESAEVPIDALRSLA